MTEGVIWKQLISFALPLAIGLLFQQLYNTVDTIVVGNFVGKQALAAVGSTGSIINMLVGVCAGLSTGASVVISQTYGSRDYKKLQAAVQTTVVITGILCVLATVAGIFIVDPMLRFMDTPDDVLPQAAEYLTIYFAGVSGLLIYNMGSAVLRAVGDSRRPLYFLCFSAVINVIFDLLFVIKYGLGIRGVAYATIMSQFLSALLVVFVLTRSDAPYAICWKGIRIDKEILSQILKVGLPSAVQQGITAFSNVFVQSYINFFGSSCMAGWSAYNKLDIYVLIPVQSIALASTTFVGQNYGSGNLPRARDGVKKALMMSLVVTAALICVLIACNRYLLILFTPEADVIEYGSVFIRLISPFYLTVCFNQIYAGALRGIGNARVPMAVMIFSFVIFRQIYLYTSKMLGGGFVAVALGYPMGWVVCSLLMIICYRRSALIRTEAPKKEPNSPELD